MASLKKILLHALPLPVREAVEEQLDPDAWEVARNYEQDSVYDLAVSGDDKNFPGCPVLRITTNKNLRLGVLLRQIHQMLLEPALHTDDIAIGAYVFHPQERLLTEEGGDEIALTDREAEMLAYLARHGGGTVSRDDLLKNVWRYQDGVDTHTLETHVYRLRQKMGQTLETIDGGYRLRMQNAEKGSVFAYILIAIFLAGLLVMTLTSGPQKSATTEQIDELTGSVQSDLKLISAGVNECVLQYSSKVDVNADGTDDFSNPNIPFPLYDSAGTSGGTGVAIKNIVCPGAPGTPVVFGNKNGQGLRTLDIFAASPIYTVNYLSDSTEGVLIRITRNAANPLWTEAISRLNGRYSTCEAANVTAGGTCANGCFYVWLLRRSTSAIGVEGGCP